MDVVDGDNAHASAALRRRATIPDDVGNNPTNHAPKMGRTHARTGPPWTGAFLSLAGVSTPVREQVVRSLKIHALFRRSWRPRVANFYW